MTKIILLLFTLFVANSQVVIHSKSIQKNPMIPEPVAEDSYTIVDENYVLDFDNNGVNYYDVKRNKLYSLKLQNGEYKVNTQMDRSIEQLGQLKLESSDDVEYKDRDCRKIIYTINTNPQFSVKLELYLSKLEELEDYDSHQKFTENMLKRLKLDLEVGKSEFPLFFNMSVTMQGNVMMDLKEEFVKTSGTIPDSDLVKEIQSIVASSK